jgi:quercetin dioxygenase-like cupin family protein
MHKTNVYDFEYRAKAKRVEVVHESPYAKIVSFTFEAGQSLPVHSHDMEGEAAICVLEGEGAFLAGDGEIPARAGDIVVTEIATPHGVRADTRMRVVVTITPPI